MLPENHQACVRYIQKLICITVIHQIAWKSKEIFLSIIQKGMINLWKKEITWKNQKKINIHKNESILIMKKVSFPAPDQNM